MNREHMAQIENNKIVDLNPTISIVTTLNVMTKDQLNEIG